MRRAGILLIIALLAGSAVVPLLLGGGGALAMAMHLSPQAYLFILVATIAGWLLRALKQGLLMRQLCIEAGPARVFAISQATELAFLATPGGVGGYAAGIWYLRGAGASYASATAIAAADQVLDLLFFALAVPAALPFLADAPELGTLREIARISVVATLIIVLVGILARRPLSAWLIGVDGAPGAIERLPYLRRRSSAVHEFFLGLRAQAQVLTAASPGFFAAVFACTALQWFARYGVLWLILILLGHPLSFALLFLLQGLVLHAGQWSGAPAGVGGADLGLAASLAPFVPAAGIATALLLWRLATLHLTLLAGVGCVLMLRARRQPQCAAAAGATEVVAATGGSTMIAGALRARR